MDSRTLTQTTIERASGYASVKVFPWPMGTALPSPSHSECRTKKGTHWTRQKATASEIASVKVFASRWRSGTSMQ